MDARGVLLSCSLATEAPCLPLSGAGLRCVYPQFRLPGNQPLTKLHGGAKVSLETPRNERNMTELTEGHGRIADDVASIILRDQPMLRADVAMTTANAIVDSLATEGWLVEPQQCEHRSPDTNAQECEAWVSPGHSTCERH